MNNFGATGFFILAVVGIGLATMSVGWPGLFGIGVFVLGFFWYIGPKKAPRSGRPQAGRKSRR